MQISSISMCSMIFAGGVTSSIVFAGGMTGGDMQKIRIDRDNIQITESCIIEAGVYHIQDTDGNGVLQISGDDIVIEFEDGAILDGSAGQKDGNLWDGIGIRVESGTGIIIRNAVIRGFKTGIYATYCDKLHLDEIRVDRNYRQHLKSTPEAEDSSDWLWPHRNDAHEWLNNYGAAIYVENANEVEIHNCFVRNSQNGIILDKVEQGKVYDNDCSFLSGWGLALWRSNGNVISRNAFDFCIRGYSDGVYNRGQDSAGILMFEQCHENIIVENSVTHGGDGFFAFAGRDALGETWLELERDRLRTETGQKDVDDLIELTSMVIDEHRLKGNNNNILLRNDFSYAAAHGIELTFSFENGIFENRIVDNAICGIWGGYSQQTHIAGNLFKGNGELGYGLERGGINIEHGCENRIMWNRFVGNKCGIHLWWDDDAGLLKTPWGKANERGSTDNTIAHNQFKDDQVGLHLRSCGETVFVGNRMTNVATEIDKDETSQIITDVMMPAMVFTAPDVPVFGSNSPVGNRAKLQGRENIIMTEWGPGIMKARL